MIDDIEEHIAIVNESIAWAKKYGKGGFPYSRFKDYRRKLKKYEYALNEKCSAAAYGESQVGKSYLISSLLSSPDCPFVITNQGKSYSFIDQLNPSGGENLNVETTGVITRFTVRNTNHNMDGYVKVQNLSVVDIILLVADSYYNDIKINPDNVLKYDVINKEVSELSSLWADHTKMQTQITEDDVRDIGDYVKEIIGNNAVSITQSDFCKVVAPVIQYVTYDHWVDIFGLLWNKNEQMSKLFSSLIKEYKRMNFSSLVYVPFEDVLKEHGTLLKIQWLDKIFESASSGEYSDDYTDVYDEKGQIIVKDFCKCYLSALTAELTFVLPDTLTKDRTFLNNLDLLDFPGARSREKFKEEEIGRVLPQILRRGKVAYLFNKYSRALRISSVLFCHHGVQKSGPLIGETINNWIEDNIGKTPQDRAAMLTNTQGIAPLFFIATKFNIDLDKTKTDSTGNSAKLNDHWNRFNTIIPEIIKPDKWLDEWVATGDKFASPYFRNIYLLRDFFYSGKCGLYEGYCEKTYSPECRIKKYSDYPNYFEDLKSSFLKNEFVNNHFENPEQAWRDVASLNSDGSKAIISKLGSIASVLESARNKKYLDLLCKLKDCLCNDLRAYYVPQDESEKNAKLKKTSSDIGVDLRKAVYSKQECFGAIIDKLMVQTSDIRNIVYDIVVRHTDSPRDFTAVSLFRNEAGIDPKDDRDTNLNKLFSTYDLDNEQDLEKKFSPIGIDDIISNNSEILTSLQGVIAKHIVDYWKEYINDQKKDLDSFLSCSDELVFMFVALFDKLKVREKISEKIAVYRTLFDDDVFINAVADFSSLILNNFVSTVGGSFFTESDWADIKRKAEICGISDIEVDAGSCSNVPTTLPLTEALGVLDSAADMIKKGTIDEHELRKLPLWDNFIRWRNMVKVGLVCVSDIPNCDPKANAEIKSLIDRCSSLYN